MSADEEVDIVDERDAVVGRTTRGTMRARGLRHRAVYVLVFNSRGELFVHRRAPHKDVYASHYDVAAGGVVAAGESYEQAAERELGEELGIRGVELRFVAELRFEDATNKINGRVYRCSYDGPLKLQEEEIVSGEWVRPEELEQQVRHRPFCPDSLRAMRSLASPTASGS